MFEEILDKVLTEYGLFVTLLIVSIGMLWVQNKNLATKLLDIIENNTRVLTQIVEKLNKDNDSHH